MRVKQISVTDLFDIFNHTIPLNMEDRITIIHGPNGFGKTILLKMIDGLFNSRYSEFRTIPFKDFRVDFDDNSTVWVDKAIVTSKEEKKVNRKVTELTFNLSKPCSKSQSFTLTPSKDSSKALRFPLIAIEREMPELERVGPDEWMYLPTGEILSLEDIVERFSDILPFKLDKEPEWWKELKNSIYIRFIETQRLLSISRLSSRSFGYEKPYPIVPAVVEYSKELAQTEVPPI